MGLAQPRADSLLPTQHMVNQRNVILAPSGAGKSWMASHYPGIFVDGDRIIASTIGWPKQHRWWETLSPEAVEQVHLQNEAVLTDYASKHPERFILFNGRWSDPELIHSIWMPESELHASRLRSRSISDPLRSQPQTIPEMQANRASLFRYAEEHDIPVTGGSMPDIGNDNPNPEPFRSNGDLRPRFILVDVRRTDGPIVPISYLLKLGKSEGGGWEFLCFGHPAKAQRLRDVHNYVTLNYTNYQAKPALLTISANTTLKSKRDAHGDVHLVHFRPTFAAYEAVKGPGIYSHHVISIPFRDETDPTTTSS